MIKDIIHSLQEKLDTLKYHLYVKNQHLEDLIGFILLGLLSFAYVVFPKEVAEQHLQLPFLNFPIFMGEIFLSVCLFLFYVKYRHNPQKLTKGHYLIIYYFAFVVIKALYGYLKWGPLALRHSALFYYPVFAVFGYVFYRRDFFGRETGLLLLLIIFTALVGWHSDYCTLTLVILGFILIKSFPHKILKFLMLLVLLLITPYKEFFYTARMMIVANLVSGLYLAGTMPVTLKIKKELKLPLTMLMTGIVIFGLFKFANHGVVKSIINFKRMAKVFTIRDTEIQAKIKDFRMERHKEVKLYTPDKKVNIFSVSITEIIPEDKMKEEMRQAPLKQVKEEIKGFSFDEVTGTSKGAVVEEMKKEPELVLAKVESEEALKALEAPVANAATDTPKEGSAEEMDEEVRQILLNKIKQEIQTASVDHSNEDTPGALIEQVKDEKRPDLEKGFGRKGMVLSEEIANNTNESIGNINNAQGWVENDNAVFRFFIWRDMLVDLAKEKPILGFDFGKPFRSKSLEIIHWGDGDWARDGWIEPHNSYLHIIYRAGIVGILLIFSFLFILFKMIRYFILVKSLTGILLCGIIINWFVVANFLVIFELPYTAIPIWTIYGMTFAYCYKTRERD